MRDNEEKANGRLTELLFPLHEVEPLLATHLEDIAQEGKTLWSWWQLPPWALKIAQSQDNNKGSYDAGRQDQVVPCNGDDGRGRRDGKVGGHVYGQLEADEPCGVLVYKHKGVN